MAGSLSFASSVRLIPRILALACTALVLVSCGDSGPSRGETAEAIEKQANSALGFFGGAQIKVEVDNLKCTKAGTQQTTSEFEFTKLGGEWRVRPK